MVLAINGKEKSGYRLSLRPIAVMQSVPGAIATGSRFAGTSSLVSQYPVATAPGTDIIAAADLLTRFEDVAFTAAGVD